MAFKVRKLAKTEMLDKRVSFPTDLWTAIEYVAKRDGVDPQEVIRQALVYALKNEIKEAKAATTV
jgi:hypothetical protein